MQLKPLAQYLLAGTHIRMAFEHTLINVSQLAPNDYRQKNLRKQTVNWTVIKIRVYPQSSLTLIQHPYRQCTYLMHLTTYMEAKAVIYTCISQIRKIRQVK